MNSAGGWSRATLRIYSAKLRVDEVDVALGLTATGKHVRGQLRTSHRKERWPDSMWRFGTSLEEDRGLEGNLVWLLDLLEPKKDIIRVLVEQHNVDLFCGFSPGDQQGGFT